MSFREKSAWVTLVTLAVLTIVFILNIPRPYTLAPAANSSLFHVMLLAIVTFVVVKVAAYIVIAVRAPRDARTPKDERERLIELKSTAVGGAVYAFLSLGSVLTIHLGANKGAIAYLVVFSFVVAEIVNYAMRVLYYRRGF